MLTFANDVWGARCGESARRVLLGETRSRGHAYSVRRRRERAQTRQAPHKLPSSRLVSTILLDLWFERQVKPRLRGEAYLVRYIDDFVICFQYRDDADRVQTVLSKRLNKFALALEPSKTKLVKFGRFAQREARVQGERPQTVSFLGFTHYGTRNRKGNYMVGRKTEKSRLRRSMANLTELMRDIRHWSLKDQVIRLNQVLRGHYAYYGLAGNWRSLRKVYRFVERSWHKMLCSRSWAAKITWDVFHRLRDLFPLQRPTIRLTYQEMQACAVL